MKLKKIFFLLISLSFALGLHAQQKQRDESSFIILQNTNTKKIKVIVENDNVRYWLNNGDTIGMQGRIDEIRDSSIVIKGKEIKLLMAQ